MQEVAARKVREAALRKEVEQLQAAMLRLQTAKAPGRRWGVRMSGSSLSSFCSHFRANTAFGTFPSRDFAKVLNSKEYQLCGQLDLTGQTHLLSNEVTLVNSSRQPCTPLLQKARPLLTDSAGLLALHSKILA